MTKLRVLVLSFPSFTDISIVQCFKVSLHYIVVPLPFRQQTTQYLVKFEILTLALGFENFKFWAGNSYKK
jgi:hypothetical protein